MPLTTRTADGADREQREARHGCDGELPALRPAPDEREHERGQTADPNRRGDDVRHIRDEREPARDAGVPRKRRCQQHQRRCRHGRERQLRHTPAPEEHAATRCCERRLHEPHRPEPRSDHGLDDVPAQCLAEPESARGGSLQHDPGKCDHREHDRQRGQYLRQPPPGRCRRAAEPGDEHQRAAADQEQEEEVERPDDREQRRHGRRRPVVEHLRRHAGRVRTRGTDVEDERARDRMTVARQRPPAGGVRAAGEPAVECDLRLSSARPLDLARVDAPSPCVVDADRAERRLHRFVEPEQDCVGALLEHRVVGRVGCD